MSQSNVSHKKAKEAEYELNKIKDSIKSLQKTIDSLRRELQKELKSKQEMEIKFEKLKSEKQNNNNLQNTRKSSTTSNASSTNTITNQGLVMASSPFQNNSTPLSSGIQNTDGHSHNSSYHSNSPSPSPENNINNNSIQRTSSSSSAISSSRRNISLVSSRSRSSIGEESTILGCDPDLREANWQYLKHVVLKFILATNTERDKLSNVLCTVLHLSAKEERLLYDTLAYKKNKVFGTKPKVNI